jgi:hypothetical protein
LWHCVYAECNRYSFGFRALTAEQMNNAWFFIVSN